MIFRQSTNSRIIYVIYFMNIFRSNKKLELLLRILLSLDLQIFDDSFKNVKTNHGLSKFGKNELIKSN